MEFKIDRRKRVKLTGSMLREIMGIHHLTLSEFLREFYQETGLLKTSRKNSFGAWIYHFKITDAQKYMLGKIKYGI